ncbi:MAG TPA: sigma-54 dependent transcriptional regulator [Vicinamibacteria bacterium]|nr:sigma-54 dependent transcriptional regulator [Vicinamibacteria bacterium]
MTERILIVDDDASFRRVVEYSLQEEGYETSSFGDAEGALQAFFDSEFSLVVTDMRMPRLSGLALLTRMHAVASDVPIIVVTGHAEVDNAVEAMREGAFDYLQKPVNRDELKLAVARALEMRTLRNENRALRRAVSERLRFERMIGVSKAIQKTFATAAQAARYDSTVLILGESGTGKEVLAKAIHFNSPRRDRPFVVVNCGAIPANLLESELFGHARGAFTGANADHKGKIEAAQGGSVFLDEIGDLEAPIQVKLLRLLQEKEIDKVGATNPIKVDVRIIAATNRSLHKLVRQNEFREDLFYRLSVIPITLPPLRQRREDIPLLAKFFLDKYAQQFGKRLALDRNVLRAFDAYHWSGNIRELENLMERLAALTEEERITAADLPSFMTKPTSEVGDFVMNLPPDGVAMENVEEYLIREALERNDWNQTRAAKFLRITRNTLIYRMQKYALSQKEDGELPDRLHGSRARVSTNEP